MDDPLQFDKADFSAAAPTLCSACRTPLTAEYWAANGQLFCARCAEGVRAYAAGSGSGALRFSRALIYGGGAALLGGAGYAAMLIFTRTEWAILSIGIGWFVGKAVRHASDNRGGWRYQLLAAWLTYTAVCGAYVADQWHRIGSPEIGQIIALIIMGYAMPFLEGFQNIIGILIIGFGVWQAWQMNRPLVIEVTGPHTIGGPPPVPRG